MNDSLLIKELPHTVEGCLSLIKYYFKESGLQGLRNPRSFLCGVTGLSSCQVIAYPDTILDDEQRLLLKKAVIRSLNYESIHRICGWRDFYNVRLALSSDTFEPRPETELLVDSILSFFLSQRGKKKDARILDLGMGSGAICLALLKENSFFEGLGVDISSKALEIARKNAVANSLSKRFCALQSNWFSSIEGFFDIIVSNPPYIESAVVDNLGPEVKNFDPVIALDGGPDGLSHYRVIADGISRHLSKNGFCGLEIGYNQKIDVIRIFEDKKLFLVNSFKDYEKNDRILLFCR
ncbi:peptide chain release factor N(5)-glutamine methyltransferase [Candidatus Liberibacter solanacearum]|uniref:peptide chain release factor N(5)-glutamine methyltransferase n=1 Tax=Candidatus Liberibacter solanacearum TaxID=556287 RepID=A0A1V2N7H3_9HYPH|nr:peptide chain release factor N(5)-glutamine methyltransferase [Candidatus Liberibacter solanacearum]ONI58833.1 protein-(glutamine-N5) methyltransferase, release factor-specific [Candidatus Liberibacter solanacearum]ONI59480.1 hypothetical protein AYJ09_03965 [Candidatus Liberibacter solanacearum]